jgi:23S rRNA (uracil1939-C5)-methyltransferase
MEEVVAALATDATGVIRKLDHKTAFVPYTLPGELIRFEVTREQSRFMRGRLLEVLTPSASRVAAPCRHFGNCGGCQIQHLHPDAHLELKKSWFLETCSRIGRMSPSDLERMKDVLTTVQLPQLKYRIRARIHILPPDSTHVMARVGFASAQTSDGADNSERDIIPIGECLILHPMLQQAMAALTTSLKNWSSLGLPQEPLQAELTICSGNWVQSSEEASDAPSERVALTLFSGGRKRKVVADRRTVQIRESLQRNGISMLDPKQGDILKIAPGSQARLIAGALPWSPQEQGSDVAAFAVHRLGFVQPHFCAPIVYRSWIRSRCAQAGLTSGSAEVWDLYGGSGLFGHSLAWQLCQCGISGRVRVVEENPHALEAARLCCPNPHHGITITHEHVATDHFLKAELKSSSLKSSGHFGPRIVIADPPRSGLGNNTVSLIARAMKAGLGGTRRDLFLISCDPAAGARDVAGLLSEGFKIESCLLADAFGMTRHYEILTHLSLDA